MRYSSFLTALVAVIALCGCATSPGSTLNEPLPSRASKQDRESYECLKGDVVSWLKKTEQALNATDDRIDFDQIRRESALLPLGLPIMCALVLTNDPALRYMDTVARVLGLCQDIAALPALVHLLDSEYPFVREEAVVSLNMIGDASILVYYRRLALEDNDSNVRANVCIGIGSMGGREYLDVVRIARKDTHELVRWAAGEAERVILSK